MTTRELELLQRAEAAERAVIEAVRQRDMLANELNRFYCSGGYVTNEALDIIDAVQS
jgi:hypothetical protein